MFPSMSALVGLIWASAMRMVFAVSEPVLRKYHTEAKRVETPDSLDVVYHVDPDERIVFVNRRWDEFARENDASDLLGAAVLGRTLTSFIAGDEILHLFALLMRDVRKTGRELTVPFRCDAPEARRRMQLTIALGDQANVVFRSRLLSSEPRPPLSCWTGGRFVTAGRCCASAAGAIAAICEIAGPSSKRSSRPTAS